MGGAANKVQKGLDVGGKVLAPGSRGGFGGGGGGSQSSSGFGQGLLPESMENAWARMTGKYPPQDPRLPAGFEWMGPTYEYLSRLGMGGIPAGLATAGGAMGVGGRANVGAGGLLNAVNPGAVGGGLTQGLAGLQTGINTGFSPGLAGIQESLVPGAMRAIDLGSAALREQNALTGNLSSTGMMDQNRMLVQDTINQLNQKIADLYGGITQTGMGIQSDLTQAGLNLPVQYMSGFYNPAQSLGLQGAGYPLGLVTAASGGAGQAPLFAQQGSSGNGGLASLGAAYLSRGKSK